MTKSFRNLKGIIKKLICSLIIGCMLLSSNPIISHAEPGFIKGLVKTSVFMVKEKQRQDKKEEKKIKQEQVQKQKEERVEERKDLFKDSAEKLTHEDLIGLSNLLDNMIDGYEKDVTDLTRKQLESRVKLRLTNKKLNQKHHRDIKDYIEKKVVLNSMTGKSSIYISPSGVGFTASPAPVLAY